VKHRTVESVPRSVRDVELLLHDPRVRRAVDKLAAHAQGSPVEPRFFGFAEEELAAIHRLARRKTDEAVDEREFVRQMAITRPVAAQPGVTDPAIDLWFALSQPEILEDFWPSLEPRTGTRGPYPGFSAKAFLFYLAWQGFSAHFDDNHRLFRADLQSQRVLRWVEESAAAATGARPRELRIATYAQTLRQMHALAASLSVHDCMKTNIALVQHVHRILGIETVRIGIDGMLWQAWVEQVGTRSDREHEIRRIAWNATPIRIDKGDGFPEFVRGYRFVALVDLVTGLPLVWTLWPGFMDEARALAFLLPLLYAEWPAIHVREIVADSAWDERWAAEFCLRKYGVILVAQRQPSRLAKMYPVDRIDSEGIACYRGDGTLFCRRCGAPLVRDGFRLGPRERGGLPLRLGDASSAGEFRLRAHCPVCANAVGRRSLAMKHHWAALSPYPHSLQAGQPGRHALRVALYARRNANEALHSAIQVGGKLGLRGAARQRTAKEPTVEAALSIRLLLRSAFMLADLRIQHGLLPAEPPPDLARTLQV
jgi:hypothetical protein